MLLKNVRENSKVKDDSYEYILSFMVSSCSGLVWLFVLRSSNGLLDENPTVHIENKNENELK